MCEYCKDSSILMQQTLMSDNMVGGMFRGATAQEIWDCSNFECGVVLDGRGYLRMVDLDDYGCLDHGEKVQLKFCPFCGELLSQDTEEWVGNVTEDDYENVITRGLQHMVNVGIIDFPEYKSILTHYKDSCEKAWMYDELDK